MGASSGGVQYCESISELTFSTFVAVHGEDQFAGWADNASGALDEGTTKGPNLPEAPQRGTLCGRAPGARVELDLKLASEVVSNNAGEHVQLVADPGLDGYVVHLTMRLELGEDTLLRTAAFVEGNDLARVHSFVGDDDLEFVPVLSGLKQVELNRQLVLALDLFSDEYEAMAGVPRLRLPAGLEVIEPNRHAAPSLSAFDQFLEDGKALERHRDGEFNPQRMQSLGDGFAEECAVDAGLDLGAGKARAHEAHAVVDEGVGPVGVVDVPGTMVDVEDLVGLGDGAKEGVVAACAFLFLVEADGGAFGMTPGAQHRPVVIERHPWKPLVRQALHDQASRFTSHFGDALFIRTGERAADRGYIR